MGIPVYSIMSLGQFTLCNHAQSENFLNLVNISIIAICSGNVPVLTKGSNGPKSLSACFVFNVGVSKSCRQVSAISDKGNVIT